MIDLLAIKWNVDPVIFSIGSVEIRYYSILFLSGFFFGYWLFIGYFKREGVSRDLLDPLLYTLLISALVGARLGHVLFYQPDHYLAHPIEILKVWEGGLASHGGAIGLLIGMWWFVGKYGKKNGFDYMWLLDRLVIAVCFAGALIRFGNLMNSEIYGNVTDLPWGFIFERNGEIMPKHPTQLYEALCYIVLGIILTLLWRYRLDKLKKGTIFGIFLIGLFGARFLIEYIKEPQVDFETTMSLNMGQWLSVPFILAGIIILIYSLKWGGPAKRQIPQQAPAKEKFDGTLKHTKAKSK